MFGCSMNPARIQTRKTPLPRSSVRSRSSRFTWGTCSVVTVTTRSFSCTAITLQMYAERKGWKLSKVSVTVTGEHAEGAFVMHRELALEGDLDDEKRARLKEIAEKCPVHKTLTGAVRIETTLKT